MKNIWVVGIGDCEGSSIVAICSTKEIAERELFKARDRLVANWKKADISAQKSVKEFCEKYHKSIWVDDMYKKMITALSGNDYKNWDNYPHDRPYLYETEVIEF